jgi:hypothetical protein
MANGNIGQPHIAIPGNFGLGSFNMESFPQGFNPIKGVPPPPSSSQDGIAALPVSRSAATSPYAPIMNWGEPVETVADPNQIGPPRAIEPIGPERFGVPVGGVAQDTNTAAVADLNAQIAALQGQLADANNLYTTATTGYEQTLAEQQATALTEQQAALEAQKQSMLGERGTLLEEQKQTMLGEREGLLAEAQSAADTRVAEIQTELDAQAQAKATEIAALQSQVEELNTALAAAEATANDYNLLAGTSEIGALAAGDAQNQYNTLLNQKANTEAALSDSQRVYNELINQSAGVFDQSLLDAQNRQTEFTMLDDAGLLTDMTNTYLPPTDLYEDARLQREREALANVPAQTLATQQYNAFSDLLGTPKIGEEEEITTDTVTTGNGAVDTTTQDTSFRTVYDNFVSNPQYFEILGLDADASYEDWLEAWQQYLANIGGVTI